MISRALASLLLFLAVLPAQQTYTNKYALVIGVTGYPRFPVEERLKYADADAAAFAAFIETPEGGSFPHRNIHLVINADANRVRLFEEFDWLYRTVGPEDLVYIFFAGHGMEYRGVSYFLPFDSSKSTPDALGVPMVEFFRRTTVDLQARQIVMFIDACHAAAAVEGFRGPQYTDILKQWDAVNAREGQVTMAFFSSLAQQKSWEDDAFRHGLFTHYLLEGLRGAAPASPEGWIRADSLWRYVHDEVEQRSRQRFPEVQTPFASPRFRGSYVVAYRDGAVSRAHSEAASPGPARSSNVPVRNISADAGIRVRGRDHQPRPGVEIYVVYKTAGYRRTRTDIQGWAPLPLVDDEIVSLYCSGPRTAGRRVGPPLSRPIEIQIDDAPGGGSVVLSSGSGFLPPLGSGLGAFLSLTRSDAGAIRLSSVDVTLSPSIVHEGESFKAVDASGKALDVRLLQAGEHLALLDYGATTTAAVKRRSITVTNGAGEPVKRIAVYLIYQARRYQMERTDDRGMASFVAIPDELTGAYYAGPGIRGTYSGGPIGELTKVTVQQVPAGGSAVLSSGSGFLPPLGKGLGAFLMFARSESGAIGLTSVDVAISPSTVREGQSFTAVDASGKALEVRVAKVAGDFVLLDYGETTTAAVKRRIITVINEAGAPVKGVAVYLNYKAGPYQMERTDDHGTASFVVIPEDITEAYYAGPGIRAVYSGGPPGEPARVRVQQVSAGGSTVLSSGSGFLPLLGKGMGALLLFTRSESGAIGLNSDDVAIHPSVVREGDSFTAVDASGKAVEARVAKASEQFVLLDYQAAAPR